VTFSASSPETEAGVRGFKRIVRYFLSITASSLVCFPKLNCGQLETRPCNRMRVEFSPLVDFHRFG